MIVTLRTVFLLAAIGLLPASMDYPGARVFAAVKKCPRGTTPVEDIVSGKVACESGDTMDTSAIRPGRAPGKPKAPRAPRKPKKAKKASSGDPKNCGLSRWGCEEACQQTYLSISSAAGAASKASQRAKVALGSCLRICAKEFKCEAKPPKSP
jgi:hypothetical protein